MFLPKCDTGFIRNCTDRSIVSSFLSLNSYFRYRPLAYSALPILLLHPHIINVKPGLYLKNRLYYLSSLGITYNGIFCLGDNTEVVSLGSHFNISLLKCDWALSESFIKSVIGSCILISFSHKGIMCSISSFLALRTFIISTRIRKINQTSYRYIFVCILYENIRALLNNTLTHWLRLP